MEKTPAIYVHELVKTYRGTKKTPDTHALKGVSLTIPEGEFFGLLGPNGAGKTSIISILAGLTVKTSGEVRIGGVSIDQDADTAKSFIGIVPQEFNFNWFETVQDIIVNQAGYYGISRKEALPRAEELMKQLGLWDKKDTQAMKLSGGMKRRLMIARALIHEPKVLLLDEPTAGVDVELRRGMWEFLRALNESGTTIVLTTHYLEEAEQLCTRIAIINNGEIIKQGSVKELLTTLSQVTLLLDTVDPITDATLALVRGYPLKKVDERTFEIVLKHGETINDVVRKLTTIGMGISSVRNPGSRLEEVFVNLIEKK